MDSLKVYNLTNTLLAELIDMSEFSVGDIEETHAINTPSTISFDMPVNSPKLTYIINENYVEWKDEYYLITKSSFEHTKDKGIVKIDGTHLSSVLQSRLNGEIKLIGKTATELMTEVLKDTGWSVGIVTVSSTTKRDLQSSEEAVYSNLKKIAEKFDAMLVFNSKTKQVDLLGSMSDRKITIRKGKNLKSINLSYDSSEIVTRLYAFGGQNDVGQEINIISKNPTGKSYLEDYSYYTSLGITQDFITANPNIFIREMTWRASEYSDAQDLYDDAVKKMVIVSKPKVSCSIEGNDLEIFPEFMTASPIIGELVTVIDEDLDLTMTAKVQRVSKRRFNPLAMRIEVSNEVIYSSIIKQLVDTSNAINKIVNPTQQIHGIYIKDATITSAKIGYEEVIDSNIKNLTADKITAGTIDAEIIDVVNLNANNITAGEIDANVIEVHNIKADNITSGKIDANIIDVVNLNANNIKAGKIKADFLDAVEIKTAIINTGLITAGSGIIAEGAIGSADILELDAGKLKAGTVDTSKITIAGANGRLKLTGNRLQVFADKMINGVSTLYERVSLGDVNGDGTLYGFRVRGVDGTTVLMDETGVKEEGITDGAITNSKISDNAQIDGKKLDINTVVTEINGSTETINGSKIMLDDKTLDVEISGLKSEQTNMGNTILNQTSQIEALQDGISLTVTREEFNQVTNNIVYKVEIISSNGQVFKNGDINTVLQARVYHGAEDVTDSIDSNNFKWKRVSSDAVGDSAWNTAHFGGTKTVVVTPSDVRVRATFTCEITSI